MKKLSEGKELAPDDLAKLSKAKAKLEIIGDYADYGEGEGCVEGVGEQEPIAISL
jgi:hypothetical protein